MKQGEMQSSALGFGACVGRLACLAGVIAATLIPAPEARAQFGNLDIVAIGNSTARAQDVFVANNRAYTTSLDSSEAGLQIYDVTNPTMPVFLGSCDISFEPRSLYVSGDFAYMVTKTGLEIFDVGNPTSPTLCSVVRNPGWTVAGQVVGGLAYIVGDSYGLQVLDVSDPSSPALLGSLALPEYWVPSTIHVSGDFAYVPNYHVSILSKKLQVVDVSNPAAPAFRGSCDMGGWARCVYAVGGVAYIITGGGLNIYDVRDPDAPTQVVFYPEVVGSDIHVTGNLAYVGDPRGLFVLDVSDPSAPTRTGYHRFDGIQDVFESGGLIYVAADQNGLWILRFPATGAPLAAPTNLTARAVSFTRIDLSWQDNANNEDGFRIQRRSDAESVWSEIATVVADVTTYRDSELGPDVYRYRVQAYSTTGVSPYSNVCRAHVDNLDLVGSYDTPGVAENVFVVGNRVYVTRTYGGLDILDVADPTTPVLLRSWTPSFPPETIGLIQSSLYVSGDFAYVMGDYMYLTPDTKVASDYGLYIIDVSDPSSPTQKSKWTTPDWTFDAHVVERFAYVLCYSSLQVVDVSDPSAPALHSSLDLPGRNYLDIHVSGDLVYVGSLTPERLQIVDVSNPAAPVLRGSCGTAGWAEGVYAVGDLAYVVTREGGLTMFDVSNPDAPAQIGRYPIETGIALHVDAASDMAYVATTYGLHVIDVSDPSAPAPTGIHKADSIRDVFVSGGLAYVTRMGRGLWIFRCPATGAPPAAPTNLRATAVSLTQVDLAWQDNADNEDGFRIERRRSIRFSDWSEIAIVGTNVITYQDWGTSVGKSYEYRVRAFHTAGRHSVYSNTAYIPPPYLLPNLTLSNSSFGPEAPMQLRPGDPLVISTFVENETESITSAFWLEIWGSRTGGLTLDRFLADSLWLEGLGAPSTYSWATTGTLYGIPDGPYTVVYAVDRPEYVTETNERDNRGGVAGKRLLVIRPQTQVDLAVENFGMTPNPAASDQQVVFSGHVINRGSEPSGPFWIEFWGSWDRPYPTLNFFLCDSIPMADLDPGTSISLVHYSRTLYGSLPSGTFMVGCFADRDDSINELDETNNYQFIDGQTLNLTAAPPSEAGLPLAGPDIAIVAADFAPAAPVQSAPGDLTTFSVELVNRGDEATSGFWLEYWGSRTGGVWLNDFLVASDPIPNLAAGASLTLVTTKTLAGVPDGPYSVVAVADRPDDVAETDEANNRYTIPGKRLLVVRPPTGANLTIENFTFEPAASGWPGLALGGVVRNTGTTDSGPFWVEFWASPGDRDYPWLDRFCCDSIGVPNLAPGEEIDLSTVVRSFYVYGVPPGTYAIIGFIDRLDNVIETDETDNYSIVRRFVVPQI